MNKQSRREFLLKTGTLGLAAIGVPSVLYATPKKEKKAVQKVAMSIANWKGKGDGAKDGKTLAARLTEAAINELGGMKRFVKKTDVVWVKPNICWDLPPEYAANTNPDVVAEIVRQCFAAGAKKVKVGDHTCNDARMVYKNSGIEAAARKAGAEVVLLNRRRFRKMKIGGNRLKVHPVYPDIHECDLVINIPVAKHHGSTRVTLGMKNYMGVVDDRRPMHQDLPTTIADITQFMKPKLCVLDATRILMANGPVGGDLKDVVTKNMVSASTDIVALDAWGAELLGADIKKVGTVLKGHEYKIGTKDYRSLKPKEVTVK